MAEGHRGIVGGRGIVFFHISGNGLQGYLGLFQRNAGLAAQDEDFPEDIFSGEVYAGIWLSVAFYARVLYKGVPALPFVIVQQVVEGSGKHGLHLHQGVSAVEKVRVTEAYLLVGGAVYKKGILHVLGSIDAIGSILSSFVMDEIKNTHGIYL